MGIFKSLKKVLFGEGVNYAALIDEGAVVIDVRSPSEFKQGNAKGSKNIPLQNLASNTNSLNNKVVILVCRSGARAGQAKSFLTSKGVTCFNAGPWQKVDGIHQL